ncbi:hypothetical protein LCGC14_0526010 [marine sediment metagenome]|uniref:Penicillin-binding protein transpeptidase domain-containing protein n=1 Tax=marine sediment metagenome TaxID=412755 RepID=A0A0F9SFH3_9ZZZZ
MAGAKKQINRLPFILALIVVFFVLVIIKLTYTQIFKHEKYLQMADVQRKRDVSLLAKRGNIYARNGLKLAVSVEKETVFSTPYLVEDKSKTANLLAPILRMKSVQIYEKLTTPKGFVFLKRKVGKTTADKIRKLGIEGIGLEKEHQRYYPSGSIAAQVLGFVGLDNKGLAGLEMHHDKTLMGDTGRVKDEKDAFGKSIPGTKGLFKKPVDGNSLVLTIDRDIQYKAQSELKNAIEEWEALSGSVVVLNPKTGEIYAMASEPTFNLNKFNKADKESFKNQSVVSLYEPGSTLKIIPATVSIQENIFNIDSMFYLPPTLNVAGKNIKEAHKRAAQNWSLAKIITESSNVGISKVGLAIGKQKLHKYFGKFGLLEKTGIDFPGEVSGYVPKPKHWYGPTIATVSFGQGIAMTPLQLARAYSVIANKGKLYRPFFVKKVMAPDGRIIKNNKPKMLRRVLSEKSAFEGILMLEKVVAEGTGKSTAIKGYTVAGKTGTAQKPKVGEIGYGDDYVSSFVGFAPAENAELLVLVVVDSPTKGFYGSQVAGPAFKNILEFSLHKLGVEPQ